MREAPWLALSTQSSQPSAAALDPFFQKAKVLRDQTTSSCVSTGWASLLEVLPLSGLSRPQGQRQKEAELGQRSRFFSN